MDEIIGRKKELKILEDALSQNLRSKNRQLD